MILTRPSKWWTWTHSFASPSAGSRGPLRAPSARKVGQRSVCESTSSETRGSIWSHPHKSPLRVPIKRLLSTVIACPERASQKRRLPVARITIRGDVGGTGRRRRSAPAPSHWQQDCNESLKQDQPGRKSRPQPGGWRSSTPTIVVGRALPPPSAACTPPRTGTEYTRTLL